MSTPAPFGPLQFQLVLLRRMADFQPDLVEDARHELSASLADMRRPTAAGRPWCGRPGDADRCGATARSSANRN